MVECTDCGSNIEKAGQTLITENEVSPQAVDPTCKLIDNDWIGGSATSMIFSNTAPTCDSDTNVNAIWVDIDDGNAIHECDGTEWYRSSREVFEQTGTPSDAERYDIWYDTDDNAVKVLRDNWVQIATKNQYFTSTTTPTDPGVSDDDIWFDSDDKKLYVYQDGSWTRNADFTQYVADEMSHVAATKSDIETNWPCNSDRVGHIAEATDTDDFFRCDGSSWVTVADKTRYHANDAIHRGSSAPACGGDTALEGHIFNNTSTSEYYISDGTSSDCWIKISDFTKYYADDITHKAQSVSELRDNTPCESSTNGHIGEVWATGTYASDEGIYRCDGTDWDFIAAKNFEGLPSSPDLPEASATYGAELAENLWDSIGNLLGDDDVITNQGTADSTNKVKDTQGEDIVEVTGGFLRDVGNGIARSFTEITDRIADNMEYTSGSNVDDKEPADAGAHNLSTRVDGATLTWDSGVGKAFHGPGTIHESGGDKEVDATKMTHGPIETDAEQTSGKDLGVLANKTADKIDYLSGTAVDDKEPKEINADETSGHSQDWSWISDTQFTNLTIGSNEGLNDWITFDSSNNWVTMEPSSSGSCRIGYNNYLDWVGTWDINVAQIRGISGTSEILVLQDLVASGADYNLGAPDQGWNAVHSSTVNTAKAIAGTFDGSTVDASTRMKIPVGTDMYG